MISIKSGGLCCGCGAGEKCGVTCVNGGGEYLIRILGTDHSFDAFPYTSAWVDASSIVNPAGQYRTVGGFGAQTVELQVAVTSASATPTVRLRAAYVTSVGGTTTVGPHTFTTTALTRVVSGNAREFYWLAVGSGTTPAGLSIRSGLTEAYIAGFHRVSKNSHPLTVSITRGGYDPNVVSATSSLSALTALRLPSFSGSVNASTAFTFAGGENSLTSFVDPASFSVTTTDIPALDATWNPPEVTFFTSNDILGHRPSNNSYYENYVNPVSGESIDLYVAGVTYTAAPYGTGTTTGIIDFSWVGSLGGEGTFSKAFSVASGYKTNTPLNITYQRNTSPYRYTPTQVVGAGGLPGEITFAESFAGPVQTLTVSFRATPGGTVLGTAVIATSIVEEAANSKVGAQLTHGYNYGGKFCGRLVSQAVFSPHADSISLQYSAGNPAGVSVADKGVTGVEHPSDVNTHFRWISGPTINGDGSWSAELWFGFDGYGGSFTASGSTLHAIYQTTLSEPEPGRWPSSTKTVSVFLHGAIDGDDLHLSTHDRPQASAPSFIAGSNVVLLHSFHNSTSLPALSQSAGSLTVYSSQCFAWGNSLPRSPFALGICRSETDAGSFPEVSEIPVTYHLATGFTLGNDPFVSGLFDTFVNTGGQAANYSASTPFDPHASFNGRTITAKSGGNTCTLTLTVT